MSSRNGLADMPVEKVRSEEWRASTKLPSGTKLLHLGHRRARNVDELSSPLPLPNSDAAADVAAVSERDE